MEPLKPQLTEEEINQKLRETEEALTWADFGTVIAFAEELERLQKLAAPNPPPKMTQ